MHHTVISAASRVDLSHLGVHTHADLILFQTGRVDLASLRSDPNIRNVRVVAHCRYPTSGSALPPGFTWLSKSYGAIPSYGPIDGDPGWALAPLSTGQGRSAIKVSVPTRFANWVAGQSPAGQRHYKNKKSYSLEIDWEQQPGG